MSLRKFFYFRWFLRQEKEGDKDVLTRLYDRSRQYKFYRTHINRRINTFKMTQILTFIGNPRQ